jgi:MFS family permease
MEPPPRKTLILLATAELLAMSLWFTGTAVLPQLERQWGLGLGAASWLTISVQLGFVVGALVAATLNLADVFSAPRIFVISALAAAAANALFAMFSAHVAFALTCRFLTGAFLAGVYPTGMKILAGWFRQGRGLALGILIAALTVGSALPHALLAWRDYLLGNVEWQKIVIAASGLAVVAAAIVAFGVREGPYAAPSPPFRFAQIGEALSNRRLRLANFGYLGHMWELYSLWGWIALLLAAAASRSATPVGGSFIEFAAFLVIAIGAVGCVWAGIASDTFAGNGNSPTARVKGRANVTIVAMAASAACCLLAALLFDNFRLLLVVAIIWGVAVIADSAQFSAIVSEVSDQRYVGTALTTQVALGFLLTTISLRVTAYIAGNYGWRWAAASLAVGPMLGVLAMMRLKSASEGSARAADASSPR